MASAVHHQRWIGATRTSICLKSSGIDFEAAYFLPMERLSSGMSGDLNFHLLATYAIHQSTTAGTYYIDRAGMTGPFAGYGQVGTPGVPDLVLDSTVTYENGPLSLTLQGHYVAEGKFDASLIGPDDPSYSVSLPNSINDNVVPSRFYVNLAGHYDVFGSGDNKVEALRDGQQSVRHIAAVGAGPGWIFRAGVLRLDWPYV